MYDGYIAFGGEEVINAERTAAYVANGHGPDGLQVSACTGDCEDFHEALLDKPYTSPIIDQPPWFDASNPDSFDFTGLVPLEISGVDGSTRTVDVVDRLGDGGIPTSGRHGPRTIGVSALAIARSECGLSAGISWLTAALHPPCVHSATCNGVALDGFSCCPAPFCPTQDPDAPLAEVDYTGENFFPVGGVWDPVTDTFVVNVNPVEINRALNPNMDRTEQVPGASILATNLILNPAFTTNTTSWTATGGTLSRVTISPDGGVAHAQISATASALPLLSHAAITVTANGTYRAHGRVKAGNAGGALLPVGMRLVFRDAANATLATINGAASAPSAVSYTNRFVQGTAPALTTNVLVSFYTTANANAADLLWYDSIALFDAAKWPGVYFDGDTADQTNIDFAWSGTAGNSTSTALTARFSAYNLVPNPGFEVTINGWAAAGGTVTYDNTVHDTGVASAKVLAGGPGVSFTATPVTGVVPGKTYRGTVRLMSPTAGASVKGKITYLDNAGTVLGTFATAEFALSPGAWTTMTVTGTAPAGTAYATVTAFEDSSSTVVATQVIYVDSMILTEEGNDRTGFEPGYFDGSSANAIWLHGANFSVSAALAQRPVGWASNTLLGGLSLGEAISSTVQYVTEDTGESTLMGGSVRSVRLTAPTDAAKNCGVYLQQTGLEENTLYTFSGWVYVPAGSPDVLLDVAFRATSQVVSVKDQWVYRVLQWKTPVGVTTEYIGARTASGSTTAGQHFYLDGVMLTRHVTVGVGAGGIPGASNTEFETGAGGWFGTTAFGTLTVPLAFTSSLDQALDETHSLKVEWPDQAAGTSGSGIYTSVEPVVAGRTYTFSCWVYVPTGSPDVRTDVLFRGAGPMMSVKDEWVRLEQTIVIPAGDTLAHFGLQATNTLAGQVVYVDRVRFNEGDRTFEFFDGDSTDGGAFYWTGVTDDSSAVYSGIAGGVGLIAGPVLSCLEHFIASWTVTPFGGNPVTVTPVAVNPAGTEILESGDPVLVNPPGPQVVGWTASFGTYDAWRPGLLVEAPGATVTLHADQSDFMDLEECIAPLRRSFHNVVTASGPTVVEKIATNDGETTLARLEWTWIAADPFQYGSTERLLTGVPSNTNAAPDFIAELVQLSNTSAIGQLLCPLQPISLISCTDDPCAPSLTPPPAAPSVPDTSFPQPAGYTRRAVQVPPELVPTGLGVFSFDFVNDGSDKVGVRVRIWEDPDPDFGNVVECGFVHEFTIAYIAPNQTFTINGPDGTVTSTCEDIILPQNADRSIRGNFGAPFVPLVVGCGNRYHIAVDVPTTYPTTCSGFYTAGQAQGALEWTLTLNRRDG